jgi:hypothetical protein
MVAQMSIVSKNGWGGARGSGTVETFNWLLVLG